MARNLLMSSDVLQRLGSQQLPKDTITTRMSPNGTQF